MSAADRQSIPGTLRLSIFVDLFPRQSIIIRSFASPVVACPSTVSGHHRSYNKRIVSPVVWLDFSFFLNRMHYQILQFTDSDRVPVRDPLSDSLIQQSPRRSICDVTTPGPGSRSDCLPERIGREYHRLCRPHT